jgi:hypothetical protein
MLRQTSITATTAAPGGAMMSRVDHLIQEDVQMVKRISQISASDEDPEFSSENINPLEYNLVLSPRGGAVHV